MDISTLKGGLPWDEADMLAWRDFLGTETGRRVVGKALESVPLLLPSGDTNAILIRSGEVRGWSAAAQAFLSLAAPPPKPPEEAPAFPPLDDDTQWPPTP